MTEALRQALALDTEAREEMADRAMRHVQTKFTKTLMCARTINLYNQLLAESGTDAAA
jgi:glycosyltransferase involved in cell wall biosynthesis